MLRATYATAVRAARRNIARLRNDTCYGKNDMCDQATSQVKIYRRNQWRHSAGDAANQACCTAIRTVMQETYDDSGSDDQARVDGLVQRHAYGCPLA